MSAWIFEVLKGAAGGVAASVILGIMGYLLHRGRRRNQTTYIRRLIVDGRRDTYRKTDRPQVSTAYFQGMCDEVKHALERRSSHMSYDQLRELRNVFFRVPSLPQTEDLVSVTFGLLEDERFGFLKLPRHAGNNGTDE